jgi:hypothetical protein
VTSRVKLPDGATPPVEVFVNGVAQTEGTDYRIEGRELVFEDRLLKKEGRLGFWRWTLIFLGLVGSGSPSTSTSCTTRPNLDTTLVRLRDADRPGPG